MSKKSRQQNINPYAIRRVMKHFAPHVRPYRAKIAMAIVYMVGATMLELLRPWPLKIVFDGILLPSDHPSPLMAWLKEATGNDTNLLALVVASTLGIAIFAGLFRYRQAYNTASVGQRVVARVRNQLYGHIQRLSSSFHDTSSSGDLIARLTGDIHRLRELLVTSIIYLSDRSLMLVGTIMVMMWMDWRLTTVALVVVPLLGFTVRYFTRNIQGATRKQRERESHITNVMAERISAIRVVQAFAREAYEEDKFAASNKRTVTAGLRATRLQWKLNRIVEVTLAAGSAVVIWFGVRQAQAGVLSPGDLIVFTSYLSTLYKPIRRLSSLTASLAKSTVCGDRIISILEIEPAIKDAPDAIDAPKFRGEVEFENVTFGYRPDVLVLRDLSFRMETGQTVALVGESGSGKSTIADLLLRFYDPLEGRILIDGTDIRRYTLASLREQIGIVMQESVLFDATIRENVTYGDLDATDEEVVDAAKQANAHEFIVALADGYETEVGERGANLSGGERQRVAITRAIIRNAPVLLLDEPMSGLDAASEEKVAEALARLCENRSTLLITHNLEAAAGADVVLELKSGRVDPVDPATIVAAAAGGTAATGA